MIDACDHPIAQSVRDVKPGFYTRWGCLACNTWLMPVRLDGRPTCLPHVANCRCEACREIPTGPARRRAE